LHDALKQLRDVGFQDWIWVDALCTAQDNDEEKNHQIPLMRHVYKQAETVLAWLGLASERLESTWEFIAQLPPLLLPLETTSTPVARPPRSEPPGNFWMTVAEFFEHPYFRRLWILQEIALARDVVLLRGKRLLSFYVGKPMYGKDSDP
jgi:hypothetical protein